MYDYTIQLRLHLIIGYILYDCICVETREIEKHLYIDIICNDCNVVCTVLLCNILCNLQIR